MSEKVAFICPVFQMYPAIIPSLICQTHPNWELVLVNNGPDAGGVAPVVHSYADPRVLFCTFPVETGHYGHPIRKWVLEEMRAGRIAGDADYVVVTNADNYHVPTYIEKMLAGFRARPDTVAAYCAQMVHNYIGWGIIDCRLELGHIDAAGVMVRKSVACDVGWRSLEHSSDWTYFSDIIERYGQDRWTKVSGCLLVHN